MPIMEDSLEDLFSEWEMGSDHFFNEGHMTPFNEEKQPVFSPENSNPSSSSLQSNFEPNSSFPTGYVCCFDNPVVESLINPQQQQQQTQQQQPKNMVESHCIEPKTHPQRNTRVHILAERKRREELTRSIIALSATIPGLKKTDKVSVVREAVNYVKKLEERVKELENETRKTCVNSILLAKKTSMGKNGGVEEVPEVKVTVLDKEVLIGIHCEKQTKCLLKTLSLLNNLHLSVTRTNVLSFGTSRLKITIIAQMDDEYNMTIDDLVKTLQQSLLG